MAVPCTTNPQHCNPPQKDPDSFLLQNLFQGRRFDPFGGPISTHSLQGRVPGTPGAGRAWGRVSWLPLTIGLLASPGAAQSPHRGGAERCADGVISSIDIDTRDVFDPQSTGIGALSWTYHALNMLHFRTSDSFIRGELLFEEGDCYDAFLAAESARLLDLYGFLAHASVAAEDDGSGSRRVLVQTRDEWSTKLDVGVTYDGGPNLEKLQVSEENFLGRGIFAEFTHRDRREVHEQSVSVSTPRLFGRADASIEWGSARAGDLFTQFLRYPFVGEAGRVSLREGFSRRTELYAFATEGAEPYSQILVPVYENQIELSGGYRFGEPGASVILGGSLTREIVRFPRSPELAFEDDFDKRDTLAGPLPPGLQRQLVPSSATRMSLHLGTRRFRYRDYVGLDGVRDHQTVGIGLFAGLTLGRSVDLFTPREGRVDDWYTRVHASFAAAIGSSLVLGGGTMEMRHEDGGWRDILADGDIVAYGRTDRLESHTLFFRVASASGWRTTMPYQLSLGGRDGVRSLAEDRFPGGRMLRFVLEDRVVLPWPSPESMDLGLTLLSGLGRIWPGDAPYGVDSGWQAALGFGLRIGLPAGTRNIWRTDIVFPVGPTSGSPIFRVTFEVNKLRDGFFTPDVLRSRRFNLGPDHF